MSDKLYYYKSNIGYDKLPFVMRDYFELIDIEETCQCRPKQKCANEQEISTKLADEQKEPEYDNIYKIMSELIANVAMTIGTDQAMRLIERVRKLGLGVE